MNFKKGFATVLAGIIVSLTANAAREPVSSSANVKPAYPAGSNALQKAAVAAPEASDFDEAGNGNPYALITSRNVFHLNPPPAPPPAPVINAPPPGTLKFTGFIKTSGEPLRALFVNVAKEATNTAYYTLKEGERDRELEVLKIHEDVEAAEVMHAGNRLTLWLTNSRPMTVAGPAAPGIPGVVNPNVVNPAVQPAVPQQASYFNSGYGVNVAGATPLPAPGAASVPPTTIPTRTIRSTPQQQAQLQAVDESARQAEINAYREAIASGRLAQPPLPPAPPGVNLPPMPTQ